MPVSEAWVDFLAGWASGAVAVMTIQPVDTVLTRVQAGERLVVGSASPNVRVQTRGLIASYGWTSLWRGSSAMISAVPMQNALLMGGYGMGKQWAEDAKLDQSATLVSVFTGGCTGGVLQSFFMSPVEMIKVNQQVHATKTAKMASLELWKGLFVLGKQRGTTSSSWRGLNATLLRDGIPHGVWFASYEWSKTTLTAMLVARGGTNDTIRGEGAAQDESATTSSSSSATEQVAIPLVSGAFAATVAWAVGYPFDIIKTRIQAAPQPTGIYQTAVALVREANGIHGLYRGFGLKLVRAVPASMIGFLTYETVATAIRGE